MRIFPFWIEVAAAVVSRLDLDDPARNSPPLPFHSCLSDVCYQRI